MGSSASVHRWEWHRLYHSGQLIASAAGRSPSRTTFQKPCRPPPGLKEHAITGPRCSMLIASLQGYLQGPSCCDRYSHDAHFTHCCILRASSFAACPGILCCNHVKIDETCLQLSLKLASNCKHLDSKPSLLLVQHFFHDTTSAFFNSNLSSA